MVRKATRKNQSCKHNPHVIATFAMVFFVVGVLLGSVILGGYDVTGLAKGKKKANPCKELNKCLASEGTCTEAVIQGFQTACDIMSAKDDPSFASASSSSSSSSSTKKTKIPKCGDGKKNQDVERCDGGDFGGQTCAGLGTGFTGGSLGCSSSCTLNTDGCTPRCGNGIVEQGEACDGTAPTCGSLGFESGSATCSNCQLDDSGCYDTMCEDTDGGSAQKVQGTVTYIKVYADDREEIEDTLTDRCEKRGQTKFLWEYRCPAGSTTTRPGPREIQCNCVDGACA